MGNHGFILEFVVVGVWKTPTTVQYFKNMLVKVILYERTVLPNATAQSVYSVQPYAMTV